jgi:hypothetical protein
MSTRFPVQYVITSVVMILPSMDVSRRGLGVVIGGVDTGMKMFCLIITVHYMHTASLSFK